MGRVDFLAMKPDPATDALISDDINALKVAMMNLINHASKHHGFGISFLRWVASIAAM